MCTSSIVIAKDSEFFIKFTVTYIVAVGTGGIGNNSDIGWRPKYGLVVTNKAEADLWRKEKFFTPCVAKNLWFVFPHFYKTDKHSMEKHFFIDNNGNAMNEKNYFVPNKFEMEELNLYHEKILKSLKESL